VAIPQTVANAGAINLFIVSLVYISQKTTRVLSSMMMSTRSRSLGTVTWGFATRCRGRKLIAFETRLRQVVIEDTQASFFNVAMRTRSNERMETAWLCPGLG
jgi:hypothetical protein